MSKEDNRTRFTFRIPDELHNQLKDKADKLGVSTNALILQILGQWEEKQDNR